MAPPPATFVLVHGAWSGGWCYHKVAARLRAAGHRVFTPTLTGQGERAHLLSGTVNLSLHITDVLNVLHYEELTEVVLAGHSYGGMVVTGVADRAADRIAALAYLDAFLPEHDQSLFDINLPANTQRFIAAAGGLGGLAVPAPPRGGGRPRRTCRPGPAGRVLQRQCCGRRARRPARNALPARLLHGKNQAERKVGEHRQAGLCPCHGAAARKSVQTVL